MIRAVLFLWSQGHGSFWEETILIDEAVVKQHRQEPEELFIYMLDGLHGREHPYHTRMSLIIWVSMVDI